MAPLMLATIMVDNGLVPKVCDQKAKKEKDYESVRILSLHYANIRCEFTFYFENAPTLGLYHAKSSFTSNDLSFYSIN